MEISIEKAKKDKLFYFVANGIIYRSVDGKCLILKRSSKEIAYPGLWAGVGGKLEFKDLNGAKDKWDHIAETLLFREAMEESGLEVENPQYIGSIAFIRPDNVPVVSVQFGIMYKSGEVKIPPEFEDYAWVDATEVMDYETIEGVKDEVVKTIEIFKKT